MAKQYHKLSLELIPVLYLSYLLFVSLKHPYKWTIFQLQFVIVKRINLFFKGRNLTTLVKALGFQFALKQIFEACATNLRLLSIVTPRISTSLLF